MRSNFLKVASLSAIAMMFSVACAMGGNSSSEKNMGMVKPNQAKPINFWWPERLDLSPLRQHTVESNPMGEKFDYAREFRKVNLAALKADIKKVLTDSQDWWPADWGHYGPFFIRMAWHSAGTYRTYDGRGGAGGGQLRFEPLNSWPDNANLDKARRLLWPVKKKYGKKVSWADLMVLTGNVAMEDMGFKTMGFAGGRSDDWEPDLVYWGPEATMLARKRFKKDGKLRKPLGAVRMGLIYVNPEGPNGNMDPLAAAKEIRETFGNMAMNDEETVALIAGGHSFGKGHGAKKPQDCVGVEPAGAGIEQQGFGWKNKCGSGKGKDTTTSGLEGAWTATPTKWSIGYLANLFAFKWVQTTTPAGGKLWIPEKGQAADMVPDAHVKGKRNAPVMYTTDLSLKMDPAYRKISEAFLKDPKKFEDAFARAWFKLTHRDMGPRSRYVGKEVPKEILSWQDPVPRGKRLSSGEVSRLKRQILNSGLTTSELVRTAWSAAASFRGTDMRGGANGGRIQLAPQKDWAANNPAELQKVLKVLRGIKAKNKKVSMADLVVLGGTAAVEQAARKFGVKVRVPFKSGRGDATQAQTNVSSFAVLEPKADGFRNFYSQNALLPPLESLVDRANLLNLTVPEMTVLVGGLRALNNNTGNSKHGLFTSRPGTLSNDFFVNLLDMSTKWQKSSSMAGIYEGIDRKSGKVKYTATPIDLIFGSHSELRAIAEVYAADDAKRKFVDDFVKAWVKVMNLDRFDI